MSGVLELSMMQPEADNASPDAAKNNNRGARNQRFP
jgi:hypothetical protein